MSHVHQKGPRCTAGPRTGGSAPATCSPPRSAARQWAMLTSYDQYTAGIFDAGRHPGAAGRRLRRQQRLRATRPPCRSPSTSCCRWSAPWSGRPSGRWSSATCRSARTRRAPAQALRTAVRFMKEGGCHAVKLEGGRRCVPPDRGDDRGRHPGDGARRVHPAERAPTGRLPGAGPRRRGRGGARRRPCGGRGRARSRWCWRWCRARWPSGSPPSSRSRPSASAPARRPTPRCWSGRTWPACSRGKPPRFVKRYADLAGVLAAGGPPVRRRGAHRRVPAPPSTPTAEGAAYWRPTADHRHASGPSGVDGCDHRRPARAARAQAEPEVVARAPVPLSGPPRPDAPARRISVIAAIKAAVSSSVAAPRSTRSHVS